jgi:hypothetical protein
MSTQDMQFVDYDYYIYLKNLLIAGKSERPLPKNEMAMLRGHITLDEAFILGMLCNA